MKNLKTSEVSFAQAKLKAISAIALIAVIGLSFTACGDTGGDNSGNGGGGGGGTLTITNIPAQYNGKFIYIPPMSNTNPPLIVVGCDSIDRTTDTYTFSTITNGSVTIPMWKREGATENWTLVRYSGSDTLTIRNIAILNVKTATQETVASVATIGIFNFADDKKATAFVNGSATKSWNDGTVWTPPVDNNSDAGWDD
jgi:hypothetical protein